MKMLFKNLEEYDLYKNSMKDVFSRDVKFTENHDLLTKRITYNWTLAVGSKRLAGEAIFEDNLDTKKDEPTDKSFIEKRISNLKKEAELLDNKIAAMNTREDFGTYKNLIQVYSEILRLIERYDWELKYSEYTTGYDRQVAIWEQNGDENIRNHKVWNVVPDVISEKDYHSGKPYINDYKITTIEPTF